MAVEEININKNLSAAEIYEQLLPQISSLISSDEPIITNLSNFAAVLKNSFNKISWVGFYLIEDKILYLGPFQGKAACTQIKLGAGVCGTSAADRETLIVADVDKFSGHIACDTGSKSEIVIPLIFEEKLIGVLDLDSYQLAAFDETDKIYLTKFIKILAAKLNFTNFVMM